MEENEKINEDPTKIGHELKGLPKSLWQFFKETISIRNEIEVENTIVSIKQNMVVKGSTVWILMCSIIVASVGLNFNSPAVIIGAMLISPLMGPIRAVGLALATNDFKLLISGLKHFGVMVAVSFVTALLYFWFTPIKDVTPELLGRVKPQAFDIFIAFFGGFAGIVASASNNKSAAVTIVPGVAIATALMPPLCTISYGIATGHWNYSLGAFYLFLLNAVFICLSTILLLRVLKFPMKEFVNAKTGKKVRLYSSIALLLIVIPSIYKTVIIVRESIFERNANSFIQKEIMANDDFLYGTEVLYNDGKPIIKVYSNGATISEETKQSWKNKLDDYQLEGATILIKDKKQDLSEFQNLVDTKAKLSLAQETNTKLNFENQELKKELDKLEHNSIKIKDLGLRLKTAFPEVKEVFYGRGLSYNISGAIDTVHTFSIDWQDSITAEQVQLAADGLQNMLLTELEIADSNAVNQTVKVIW